MVPIDLYWKHIRDANPLHEHLNLDLNPSIVYDHILPYKEFDDCERRMTMWPCNKRNTVLSPYYVSKVLFIAMLNLKSHMTPAEIEITSQNNTHSTSGLF